MYNGFYGNPYQYQPFPNAPQAPQSYRGDVVRVNGRAGAEAFTMAANSSVLLLDESASNILWLKRTDGAGYATLTPYTFAPFEPAPAIDINALDSRVRRIEEMLSGVQSNATNVKAKSGKSNAPTGDTD